MYYFAANCNVNLDEWGEQHYTPLMIACRKDDVSLVKLLLEKGANYTLRSGTRKGGGGGTSAYGHVGWTPNGSEIKKLLKERIKRDGSSNSKIYQEETAFENCTVIFFILFGLLAVLNSYKFAMSLIG